MKYQNADDSHEPEWLRVTLEEAVFNWDYPLIEELMLQQHHVLLAISNNTAYHYGFQYFVTIACHNIAVRSALELSRAKDNLYNDIELLAWHSRNLFEMNLILEYILFSEENMKRWYAQMYKDEIELIEGFELLDIGKTDRFIFGEQKLILETKLNEIASGQKKPMKNMSDTARSIGRDKEYSAFYKVYSKYVHPTSWLLNEAKVEEDSLLHKGIFIIQSYKHAVSTSQLIYVLLEDENHWSRSEEEE